VYKAGTDTALKVSGKKTKEQEEKAAEERTEVLNVDNKGSEDESDRDSSAEEGDQDDEEEIKDFPPGTIVWAK
jgi:hypothetical protein